MTVSKQRKTAHIIDTVEDLQTQVDGKAASSHNHAISDVTGLQTALDDKAASGHNHDGDYAAANHNHDGTYQPVGSYAAASHTHVIGDVTGLQTALDGKAASSHNHDSDYAAINHNHDSDYAAAGHNHDSDYAAVSHNHDSDYATANHTHAVASSSSDGFMSSAHAVRVNNMRQNAGAGLTKDSSQRFAHADTSSVADTSNSGATVIQDLSFDTFGHVQSHGFVEVTPSLIGAAASDHNHDSDYASASHNHDSDYAAANHNHDSDYAAANHTHDLSDINVDAGLDMSSNSITNVTTLSSNNLVLATGGTLTSSATWSQGGATTFSDDVTINDSEATISDGALTIESGNPSSTPPTLNLHTLNQNGSVYRGFTMAHNSVDPRKFEIYFPKTDTNGGKAKVIHQDADGGIYIEPKGTLKGARFVHDGSTQLGWSGATSGSDLLGSSTTGTGVQFRHDGWTAISSSHSRVVDINRRSTSGEAIRFRDNGSYAGAFVYSSGAVSLSTPSDRRNKTDIEDMKGALKSIQSLMPKTFHQSGDVNVRRPGLIAQDVEQNKSFRQAVHSSEANGLPDFKSLDYGFFIPHLIGAVKELSHKISELEQRLNNG